jgi:hypothetical protein
MQSRMSSLIEAVGNTAIGFVISLVVSIVVLPHYGVKPDVKTNVEITLIFTVTSVIRSYVLRRYFNARLHNFAERVSKGTD